MSRLIHSSLFSFAPEVVLHDLFDSVKEAKDHGDVGVGLGRGHNVQVGVADEGQCAFWQTYEWGQAATNRKGVSV